jgi:hypothetical protein
MRNLLAPAADHLAGWHCFHCAAQASFDCPTQPVVWLIMNSLKIEPVCMLCLAILVVITTSSPLWVTLLVV